LSDQDPIAALNVRHRKWVYAYVENAFSASEADRACSYKDVGKNGWKLLQRDDIQAALKHLLKKHEMSAEEAMARLTGMGRADIADVMFIERDEDGNVIQAALSIEQAIRNNKSWLIKEASYDKDGRLKVKLHDAQSALVDILKLHGRFPSGAAGTPDDPIHHVGMSFADWKRQAEERRAKANEALSDDRTHSQS
jgi:phage terminase small subunit